MSDWKPVALKDLRVGDYIRVTRLRLSQEGRLAEYSYPDSGEWAWRTTDGIFILDAWTAHQFTIERLETP